MFTTFLTIASWAVIAINTLAWVITIRVVRTSPQLQPTLGWLDFGMLLAICWLIAQWVA